MRVLLAALVILVTSCTEPPARHVPEQPMDKRPLSRWDSARFDEIVAVFNAKNPTIQIVLDPSIAAIRYSAVLDPTEPVPFVHMLTYSEYVATETHANGITSYTLRRRAP